MTELHRDFDVIVVGAGAAGLTALRDLDRAGRKVLCVEARDRVGGRVMTIGDPLSPIPIELGAEFIHGRPPEIWEIVRTARLSTYDCLEQAVHLKDGGVESSSEAWELVDRVMTDMTRVAEHGPDRTFLEFIEQSPYPDETKQLAISYVEGFNAARKERISIASLAIDGRASDEIKGNQSFRIANGYSSVLNHVLGGVDQLDAKLKLNSIVERIEWLPGSASVHVRSALTGHMEVLSSRAVAITVPLGVLQAPSDAAGAICFAPEPAQILEAAKSLEFGQVVRVVLCFRKAFWENMEAIADAGFLLCDEKFFRAWWKPLPMRAPVLTGWSSGPYSDELLDLPKSATILCALADLARITNSDPDQLNEMLKAAYYHDWHGDPFSRGAYSYVPVGAVHARRALAEPVENTLFFAGEATEFNGHSATVHGAMATGTRAAQQVLACIRR